MISAAVILMAFSSPPEWARNDLLRPIPRKVEVVSAIESKPPADAIVLFNGKNLSAWKPENAGKWTIQNGLLTPSGTIRNYLATSETFKDIQLHLEFRTPNPAAGVGQKRGNSGVFLMGAYELQIMDPIDNPTFADGLPGAIYGQTPPDVLAARNPGEWQSYDIVFKAPIFKNDMLVKSPTVTVFLNGVLVQHNTAIKGDTRPKTEPPQYVTREASGPLVLQDHGDQTGIVQYRNIWVRRLGQDDANDE